MKRLSITLFAVAFLCIAVTAAYFYKGNSQAEGKLSETPAQPIAASYGNANLCESDMLWVTIPEAVRRVREYGDKQWDAINKKVNRDLGITMLSNEQFVDSRFITFPMDSIRKFICKVEQMIVAYNNRRPDGSPILPSQLGIRFYYATYPGLTEKHPANSYKGRHSLLLVPTYRDTAGAYIEFFPAYVSATGVPMQLRYVPKGGIPGRPITMMLVTEEDAAKNQGTLCPPPNPCSADLLNMARQ